MGRPVRRNFFPLIAVAIILAVAAATAGAGKIAGDALEKTAAKKRREAFEKTAKYRVAVGRIQEKAAALKAYTQYQLAMIEEREAAELEKRSKQNTQLFVGGGALLGGVAMLAVLRRQGVIT